MREAAIRCCKTITSRNAVSDGDLVLARKTTGKGGGDRNGKTTPHSQDDKSARPPERDTQEPEKALKNQESKPAEGSGEPPSKPGGAKPAGSGPSPDPKAQDAQVASGSDTTPSPFGAAAKPQTDSSDSGPGTAKPDSPAAGKASTSDGPLTLPQGALTASGTSAVAAATDPATRAKTTDNETPRPPATGDTARTAASATSSADSSAKTASDTPRAAEKSSLPQATAPADSPSTPKGAVAPTSGTSGSGGGRSPAPPPPPPQKSRVFPLILGGVIAGGIGFGVQYYITEMQGTGEDEIATLRAELNELRAELADLPEPPPAFDSSGIETELAALRDDVTTLQDQVDEIGRPLSESDLTAVEDEIADLRALLAETGTDEVDLSPLQERLNELASMREELASTQRAEIASLRDALSQTDAQLEAMAQELADVRDLSERRVVEAEAAIDTARAQSGLDSLRAALETGASYTDAVNRLEAAGVEVPDALSAPASSGVATVERLQDDFPAAARAALRASLQQEDTESTTDRLANFLRAQIGARSTAPREGDDPDAVLSRAEAAVMAGEIAGALSELDDLPETGRSAMADWLRAAEMRLAAFEAVPDLTSAISTE